MHDRDVRERIHSAWQGIEVAEPDLDRIRGRGRRRSLVRALGTSVAAVVLILAVAVPVSEMAGLGTGRGGDVLDGGTTASPSGVAEVPPDAIASGSGVYCGAHLRDDDGDLMAIASKVPDGERGDPVAACVTHLRDLGYDVAVSSMSMCWSPGSGHVYVSNRPDCGNDVTLEALPPGYWDEVDRVEDARRRIQARFPEGGVPCFDHVTVTDGTKEILADVGLDRWTVLDEWTPNGSPCAWPSVWDFARFELTVKNEP